MNYILEEKVLNQWTMSHYGEPYASFRSLRNMEAPDADDDPLIIPSMNNNIIEYSLGISVLPLTHTPPLDSNKH